MLIRRDGYFLEFSWRLVHTIPLRMFYVVEHRLKRLTMSRVRGANAIMKNAGEYIAPVYATMDNPGEDD